MIKQVPTNLTGAIFGFAMTASIAQSIAPSSTAPGATATPAGVQPVRAA